MIPKPLSRVLIITLFFPILFSCSKEDEPAAETKEQLNSFSLNLENKAWIPTVDSEHPCNKAFYGAWTIAQTVDGEEIPVILIKAFKFANGKIDEGARILLSFRCPI